MELDFYVVTRPRSNVTTIYLINISYYLDYVVTRPRSNVTTILTVSMMVAAFKL